jgi:cytochrome c553
MPLKTISTIIAALVLITSVRCNVKSDAESIPLVAEIESKSVALPAPEQLKNNCYICHNPNAPSHDAIIAPPLAAVKMRYKRQYQTKVEFVNNMTEFLLNPKKENAIMYGAVDRFGIMAKSVLDEKTIREIVEYVYSTELEEPPWLKEEMGNRGMQQ